MGPWSSHLRESVTDPFDRMVFQIQSKLISINRQCHSLDGINCAPWYSAGGKRASQPALSKMAANFTFTIDSMAVRGRGLAAVIRSYGFWWGARSTYGRGTSRVDLYFILRDA